MGYVADSLEQNEELVQVVKFHILGALRHPIQAFTTDRAVTNKKIVTSHGLISRKTDDMRLTKIEGIQVKQGMIGRIVGYGTVVFQGTGSGNVTMDYVPNPVELKKTVGNLRDD
jgi:uncharacterized membrane protein YdbT with pleckstrin-like domain|tara:strand:+ start:490 stop:831 length:342 start_codon:yes stop_codon:yes gene_type:complete